MKLLIALGLALIVAMLGYQFYYILTDIRVECAHLNAATIQCKTTEALFSHAIREQQSTAKDVQKAEVTRTLAPKAIHLKWVLKDGSTLEFATLPGRSTASLFQDEARRLTAFSQDPTAPPLTLEFPTYGFWVLLLLVVGGFFYSRRPRKKRATSSPSL